MRLLYLSNLHDQGSDHIIIHLPFLKENYFSREMEELTAKKINFPIFFFCFLFFVLIRNFHQHRNFRLKVG